MDKPPAPPLERRGSARLAPTVLLTLRPPVVLFPYRGLAPESAQGWHPGLRWGALLTAAAAMAWVVGFFWQHLATALRR